MLSFVHLVLALAATTVLSPTPFVTAHRTSLVSRAHKVAIKRSAGFAHDLRVAFSNILVPRSDSSSSPSQAQKVYCIPSPDASNSTLPVGSPSSLPSSSATSKFSPTSAASSPSPSASSASSPWKPISEYSGSTFFDGWSFWNTADPTHGTVQYLSQSDAQNAGLIEINSSGHALMRVDTTATVSSNRASVRITTDLIYTQGLVILDATHMPTGCGTWPAFWSNGPNWPLGGEIDIIEGINDYTNNQATIHTSSGCSLSTSSATQLGIASTVVGGTDCAAAQTGNQGCGMRSNYGNTFGSGFNGNGGGVYAMLWQSSGIQVYFFPRGSIPDDIAAGAPQPQTWSTPMANWPSTDCDMASHFYNHSVIFDTTLCGDWAGSAWNSTGVPGQDQSCAQRTGYSTCAQFVQQSGASFSQAYWEVVSVAVYQYQS